MVHTLEKNYFKKYLHKNCHRNWFSKDASNAKYKNVNGTFDVGAYTDEYTVRVREVLEDPRFHANNRIMRHAEVGANVGVGGAAFTAALYAATFTGPFAPIAATTAWVMAGAGGTLGVLGQVAGSYKNDPYDVYFHITGDDSYWKIEQVQCDSIREWAYKICKWSNEVYKERYIQKRSDNYEFQAQIEQRPSTPY